MTFQEILQQYVNMSYEELVAQARLNLEKFMPTLRVFIEDKETQAKFLLLLIGVTIGADGELTDLEVKFINEVMNIEMDKDTYLSMLKMGDNEEARSLLDRVIDQLDVDSKAELLSFVTCVMAVDETISRNEAAYIYKLIMQ